MRRMRQAHGRPLRKRQYCAGIPIRVVGSAIRGCDGSGVVGSHGWDGRHGPGGSTSGETRAGKREGHATLSSIGIILYLRRERRADFCWRGIRVKGGAGMPSFFAYFYKRVAIYVCEGRNS